MRGRKPIPSNVHVLRGNPGGLSKAQLTDDVIPDVEIPTCPAHLSAEARTEWKRITPELEKLGLISQIDRAALAVYCQAYGRWVHAERTLKELGDAGFIEETPSGYRQIGVWLQISNRAVSQMKAMMVEFGMTPSARARVCAGAKKQPDDGRAEAKKDPARFFTG